jgi:hypothetical protein
MAEVGLLVAPAAVRVGGCRNELRELTAGVIPPIPVP